MPNSRPLADRFWEKVDVGLPSECWEWTASRKPAGYGQIGHEKKALFAHRVSYELNVGAIPDGLVVRHKCHNTSCVNPSHLCVGTPADNVNDTVLAGRSCKGIKHGNHSLGKSEVELVTLMYRRHHQEGKRSGVCKFLGRWFGVSHQHITNIATGKRWRHINVVR